MELPQKFQLTIVEIKANAEIHNWAHNRMPKWVSGCDIATTTTATAH